MLWFGITQTIRLRATITFIPNQPLISIIKKKRLNYTLRLIRRLIKSMKIKLITKKKMISKIMILTHQAQLKVKAIEFLNVKELYLDLIIKMTKNQFLNFTRFQIN